MLFVFRVCNDVLSVPCGHLLGKGWPLVCVVCDVVLCFVTFPYGVLGQVWYLIVSILDLWLLSFPAIPRVCNKICYLKLLLALSVKTRAMAIV